MSEAVVASDGTVTLDWLLLFATSEGDGLGAAGIGVTAGGIMADCTGTCRVWLESAAVRVEATPASRLLPAAIWLRLADAAFIGTGAGLLFVVAAAGASGGLAADVVAIGAAAAGGGAGWLLAVTTGLDCGDGPEWR